MKLRRVGLFVLVLVAAAGGWWLWSRHHHQQTACVQHLLLHQRVRLSPGNNAIVIEPWRALPRQPGWIVGMQPDLFLPGGSHPLATRIHLHHVSWHPSIGGIGGMIMATGQERASARLPAGYGWRFRPQQRWLVGHMIHNFTPHVQSVMLALNLDFVPADAGCARNLREAQNLWVDATGGQMYPAFDVPYRPGLRRAWIYPRDAGFARGHEAQRRVNRLRVPHDGTLLLAIPHMHPGALYADLWLRRGGRRVRLFRSHARYTQRTPAGGPTWSLAFERSPRDWRVQVRGGDVLEITAAFDARRSAWAQQMALMLTVLTARLQGGEDPFRVRVDRPGWVLSRSQPENRDPVNAGLPDPRFGDARRRADGPRLRRVEIRSWRYSQGDLRSRGVDGRPPVLKAGSRLEFYNRDARISVPHSVTACRSPCWLGSGGALPLADGWPAFDSGDLGFGPRGATATVNRDRWRTPRLPPGTYTYFCRLHPDMRGAFRVRGS